MSLLLILLFSRYGDNERIKDNVELLYENIMQIDEQMNNLLISPNNSTWMIRIQKTVILGVLINLFLV